MSINTRLLTTVYAPDDQLISDWLSGAGIDVYRQKKGLSPFELTIGPLAEIKLFVPVEQYEEACQLLAAMVMSDEEQA